ncbi:phosphotransferase family protein [Natronococcus sp. JC468]|uniref:phosphotransferase family protein n=1 Tax=Natronococcus sp. JC468 TaxID=1961921 RepID=UPI00143B9D81|nr:phosphotransferase family protein [Natronococcus sp. JC468]NKE37489.1 phosphotransferase family protein [Natronococcus sp. JC468]
MTDDDYLDRLVDEASLRSYLAAALGEANRLDVERVDEGHSNETLFVAWDDEDLVVRRPPPGETADTAHDVLREHRVVSALQDTDVPVPETVLACEDRDVLGSEFYVMRRLEGDVIRAEEPPWLDGPDARRAVGEELVATLAAIHGVDYDAVGLGEFGRPSGFTDRQVERWRGQFEWALETTAEHRALEDLDRVTEWLESNVPETHPETLVHGDFKLDNVMFARPEAGTDGDPETLAVFDWEMATLGDPFTDLGWMLSFWYDEGDPDPPIPGLYPTITARDGYPSRRALIERYERHTGLSFDEPRFYLVLATYKMAALGEMFFARHLSGDSDDPLYPKMETGVPALLDRAVRLVDGTYDI